MRNWTWLISALAVGPGGLTGPRPASAQVVTVPVVLSGTPAPSGGNYGSFTDPLLNAAGQVGFMAGLVGGSSAQGLFVGAPGQVQAAALTNTPAPAGGTYSSFSAPGGFPGIVLNGSGQLAFYATLTGGSSTHGLFVGAPGAVQAAALQGTAAPLGGNYNNISFPTLSGSGQAAFTATLTGGSSNHGVFAGAPGSVQAVALTNTPAPAGGNYSDFLGQPRINEPGQVAFRANLTGGSSSQGQFVGVPGSVQAVALRSTPAPAGGTYSGFSGSRINASGQVAFVASLTGGSSTQGVFTGVPGSVQAVALNNTAAPAGGTYSDFSTSTPLNGSGQVAFNAGLTGGSSSRGIFMGVPGSVQAAALTNTPAPDGGTFSSFSDTVLNGAGQVAFLGTLTGAGVTTANDQGLYAGSVGALVKVVREGDQVDVDPGPVVDLRTIANFGIHFDSTSDGRGLSFSDAGFLTYSLGFTDGSSGIFLSSIPVPEPASAGLVAVGLTALAWLKRRDSRRHV